ncbi:MAG: TatD family hydrolase [Candidatus Omnitrophota bacterium]
MLIDTHCHLDFPEFDSDRDEVLKRANLSGIGYVINVGSSIEGSRKSLELANKYGCVYAVAGIHPHEADNPGKEAIAEIRKIALSSNKVVAIGEIGLDYYRNFSKAENQQPLFVSLIELAKELNLPLVLHSRQAEADTLSILKKYLPLKAVVHCFSGGEEFLKDCLGLGFFVSFTCNITYKKAENLRAVAKLAALERIMLETDCPYLSPEGMRGKRNEPSSVKLLAEEMARIKGISPEQVAEATTANAVHFFKLET